jgi:hypothetical protein
LREADTNNFLMQAAAHRKGEDENEE